jgi:hypothetical protein
MDDASQAGVNPAAFPTDVRGVPELPSVTFSDAIAFVEPRVLQDLLPLRRSFARRTTERLILGFAALASYAALIGLPTESPHAPQTLRGTLQAAEIAPAESAAAMAAYGSRATPPPWFSPQLLYVPSWRPPPSGAPQLRAPTPAPRPTP